MMKIKNYKKKMIKSIKSWINFITNSFLNNLQSTVARKHTKQIAYLYSLYRMAKSYRIHGMVWVRV